MNTFVQAVSDVPALARTENGMKAQESSMNALVDLFYTIGASRGMDLSVPFFKAYAEDETLALRLLAWARDVRGGAGEREVVRKILLALEQKNPEALWRILPFVPEFGRWDDILIFETKAAKDRAFTMLGNALREGNQLAAKWTPRKGPVAAEIRAFFGMTPKQYRKGLVELTDVVESKMCANAWSEINYSHVPSLAASRYQKAFKKHDEAGYNAYKAKLTTGEAKVNAGAVYPYDVIKARNFGGDDTVIQAQWDALPNYVGDQLVLPMCDVSSSMFCPAGGNPNLTCLDVSVSLGLYLADKNTGPFKDMFLTFSEKSKIHTLKGNLISKLNQLESAEWGTSTNLHAAFDAVLNVATKGNVRAEDMPKYIVIFSDMQFDQCICFDDSASEMIKRKYQAAGYEMPNVIFWNLNARNTSVPVSYNTQGFALVSGFSPSVMATVLKDDNIDPMSVVLDAINAPRYQVIQ